MKGLRIAARYVDFIHFIVTSLQITLSKTTLRSEISQNKKFERLKQEYLSKGIDPDKVIFSLYVLNKIEKKVLSRGLKFCVRPDKLDYCQTLTPFENLPELL